MKPNARIKNIFQSEKNEQSYADIHVGEYGYFLGPLIVSALLAPLISTIVFIISKSIFVTIVVYYTFVASIFLLVFLIDFIDDMYSTK